MVNSFETIDLSDILMVGDKVLVKSETEKKRTKSGLYLPVGLQEKEKMLNGYVMKSCTGYPPSLANEGESWKPKDREVKYLPLEVKTGDRVIFLQNNIWEVCINSEKYFIVLNSSLLMLIGNDDLF
jgi:co-chaperonin GroES (HSP10)